MHLRLQGGMQTSTLYVPLNQKQFEPYMLAEPKTFLQSCHSWGPLSVQRKRERRRDGEWEEEKNEKEERLNLSANTKVQ